MTKSKQILNSECNTTWIIFFWKLKRCLCLELVWVLRNECCGKTCLALSWYEFTATILIFPCLLSCYTVCIKLFANPNCGSIKYQRAFSNKKYCIDVFTKSSASTLKWRILINLIEHSDVIFIEKIFLPWGWGAAFIKRCRQPINIKCKLVFHVISGTLRYVRYANLP